jgi:integrase
MGGNKVINAKSFRDGRVYLYQLENRPQQKWLCRIKIPKVKGYIYRGTGTSDDYEARKFAEDLYEELSIKVKLGQSVKGTDFKKLVADFEAHYPAEAPSERRVADICLFLNNYFLSYIKENKLTELSEAAVTRFFDWRRKNPKKKAPSNATILAEMSHFKVFTDWCYRRGHLHKRLEFTRPSVGEARRPHFTGNDWTKLTRHLREWVNEGAERSGPIYRDRVMLTNYVLVLANTGLRVGEARSLKWSDIEYFDDDEGNEHVAIMVRGKTGEREVVGRPDVKEYLGRILDLRCEELGAEPPRNDYVFCHRDGKPIHSFKKGFAALIRAAGVEFDSKGDRRVIYSLRHTYATFRLHAGTDAYTLAQNMGTSVKMLEAFYGHTSNRAMASELTKTRRRRAKLPKQFESA